MAKVVWFFWDCRGLLALWMLGFVENADLALKSEWTDLHIWCYSRI